MGASITILSMPLVGRLDELAVPLVQLAQRAPRQLCARIGRRRRQRPTSPFVDRFWPSPVG
jgi:hypothetical protein